MVHVTRPPMFLLNACVLLLMTPSNVYKYANNQLLVMAHIHLDGAISTLQLCNYFIMYPNLISGTISACNHIHLIYDAPKPYIWNSPNHTTLTLPKLAWISDGVTVLS